MLLRLHRMRREHREETTMFDFHTHILPGIDDGSRNVQESVAMIEELTRQGATGIAATPHFYAQHSSPEQFFAKRSEAWARLELCLREGSPEIRLGAEVQYFEGINRYDGLEQFCIEGTRLLLLEMPVCTWTGRMVDTVAEINSRENLRVLLAHIERYMPYRNKAAWKSLLKQGVLIQASTDFFIEKRWKALKLMRDGYVHLLGSDSHNMTTRKPNLAPALEAIIRKKGTQLLRELEQREVVLLNEAESDMDRRRDNGVLDLHPALRKSEKSAGG